MYGLIDKKNIFRYIDIKYMSGARRSDPLSITHTHTRSDNAVQIQTTFTIIHHLELHTDPEISMTR